MSYGGGERGESRMERKRAGGERWMGYGRVVRFCFLVGFFKVVVSESGIWLQSDPRETVREN